MTSTASSAQLPVNAAQSANAAASAVTSGTTSPTSAVPAQPAALSYASATKKQFTPPPIASSTPPAAVGGAATPVQHGQTGSGSPVNGNNPISPAVPAVGGAPTIVNSSGAANGAPAHSQHTRRQSSMTISASGTSGYLPNGGPVAPSNRPNINFGSMNADGSPAMANSVPHPTQTSSLNAPPANPRITSPATSPSPIPQPAASGGRPPSLGGPGNGLNFVAMGENGEHNSRAMPQGPHTPSQNPAHLRRESAQSTHSDMGAPGMNMNRNFPPHGGRGRGYPPYAGPVPGSPGPNFRPMGGNPRPGSHMPGQFQNQGPMGPQPQSPYRATRSPAVAPAAMQQQVHMVNNQAMQHGSYGGYPQHLPTQQVRVPSSSSRRSLSEAHPFIPAAARHKNATSDAADPYVRQDAANFSSDFSHYLSYPAVAPDDGGSERYLTVLKSQGMYGMPSQYDQAYAHYQANPYAMHPYMQFPGAPPSPRQFNQTPHSQQPYMPGQYGNAPHGQSMSRTPSQVSERPPSTLGQPPTPALSNSNQHAHTPSQGSSSPAPSANKFTIPQKGKGLVIKRPDGEVITFDKKSSSPAPAPSRSPSSAPVVVSSSATPPSQSASQHVRTESKVKTDAEKKLDFQEQVKKQLEAEEKRKKEEEEKASEKTEAEAKAAKDKAEAEKKAAEEKEAEAEAARAKAKEAEEESKAKKEVEEKARLEAEEMERMIAEMEAAEKEEEERERKFQEKKKLEAEEKKKRAAEEKANADEEMKRAEREAEAAEEAKEKKATEESAADKDAQALFASLKKPSLGPGANAPPSATESESRASTPASDTSMPPPAQRTLSSGPPSGGRPKPTHLKLETHKPVEPPQPTPGMQALKSARFIQVQSEILYPEGIKSPNPAVNQGRKGTGLNYDKGFLLQFQDAFKEKPSVDWDNRVKETVGDTDSAGPKSARTPMGGPSRSRPNLPTSMSQGVMGSFQGRTLPPGTTSQDRFAAASQSGSNVRPPTMTNPLASLARPGGFPVGGPVPMSRTNSLQTMGQPGSPRVGGSSRGKGGSSRRGAGGFDKSSSHRHDDRDAKTMPLTAGQDLKPLEASGVGWKPLSIGGGRVSSSAPTPGGKLTPDVVQRKVKAALNKMTPEKFDRISDQVLEIAAQSKDESDGRTLRQVIALTFEKACDEAHWASMYAKFCKRMLETMSTEIKDENVRDKLGNPVLGGALFRKYLLNRCQEEFERGWEVNLPMKKEGDTEEAVMLSDEYYVMAAAKRRGLGLVQFIGELYKLGMLTTRIMHECVHKLLNFEGLPDESSIESLVKLLKTIGATMDKADNGPSLLSSYFDRIEKIMNMDGLPSRLRYMLLDTVDLRKNGWNSKDDAKGPKTITEIREEAVRAAQQADLERQRQHQRGGPGRAQMGRGDARNFSGGNMMPPPDYSRNTVGMDDLRRLGRGQSGRNASQSQATLGPVSMLGSRSNSGRSRLGPGMSKPEGDSGGSSRTGTPPVKSEKESASHANAFSALAGLDASGEGADEVASPPSTTSSPPVTKSKPVEGSSLSKSTTVAGEDDAGGDTEKKASSGDAAAAAGAAKPSGGAATTGGA